MIAKRDFTDRFLKAIKPAEAGKRPIIWDAQISGFGIRVTDKSTDDHKGSFVLVTRFPGSDNPVPRRIGDYPALSLAKARQIAREWRPIGANRTLAYLKTFFTWAVDQELIEASPAASVKRPTKEVKRDRVLTDTEIRAIWQACGELGAFGRAFRFMLATGQRRSEVGEMTWDEVDRTQLLWTLSRERTKADRAHEIPLSPLAMSIIEVCPRLGDFVFSTGRSAPAKPDATGAVRPISGWSKAKASLNKLAFEKAKAIAVERGENTPTKIADWHLHDLRRTCATHMAKLGVDRVVISKILNHAENEVTAVYDRHRYDHEKRQALDLWGERLAAIVDSPPATNVVAFRS